MATSAAPIATPSASSLVSISPSPPASASPTLMDVPSTAEVLPLDTQSPQPALVEPPSEPPSAWVSPFEVQPPSGVGAPPPWTSPPGYESPSMSAHLRNERCLELIEVWACGSSRKMGWQTCQAHVAGDDEQRRICCNNHTKVQRRHDHDICEDCSENNICRSDDDDSDYGSSRSFVSGYLGPYGYDDSSLGSSRGRRSPVSEIAERYRDRASTNASAAERPDGRSRGVRNDPTSWTNAREQQETQERSQARTPPCDNRDAPEASRTSNPRPSRRSESRPSRNIGTETSSSRAPARRDRSAPAAARGRQTSQGYISPNTRHYGHDRGLDHPRVRPSSPDYMTGNLHRMFGGRRNEAARSREARYLPHYNTRYRSTSRGRSLVSPSGSVRTPYRRGAGRRTFGGLFDDGFPFAARSRFY